MQPTARNIYSALLALALILVTVGRNHASFAQELKYSQLNDPCYPAEHITSDQVFSSKKIVFAHYISLFQLSIDNRPFNKDYYAQNYLSAAGENGKWSKQGGFLRARPLPVAPSNPAQFRRLNMETEIRLAISHGIGGFAFDVMNPAELSAGGPLQTLLEAVADVDKRFKILLMPDMGALGANLHDLSSIVSEAEHLDGLYHTSSNALVVAPFMADAISPSAWQIWLENERALGFSLSLFPTALSLDQEKVSRLAAISIGLGTFGSAVPDQANEIFTWAMWTHQYKRLFMAGISAQDYRPKDQLFWEPVGSLTYRSAWQSAIDNDVDFVQLTTWNDFSESTQIEPYTDLLGAPGLGFFNMTEYFASWYLSSKRPKITHDVLYYFYRKQRTDFKKGQDQGDQKLASGSPQGQNLVEVVAFLTSPGEIVVRQGTNAHERMADVGMTSFQVEAENGRPLFALYRSGKEVFSFEGTPKIDDTPSPAGYSDLTYWSNSASSAGVCVQHD